MPTILEPTWRDWVLLNLQRGCAHDSLIADMIREGHEPEFARSVVKQLALDPNSLSRSDLAPANVAALPSESGRSSLPNVSSEQIAAMSTRETTLPPPVASPPTSATASFVYEPSRLEPGNIIRTPDRDVRVTVRMTKPDLVVFADFLSVEECDELVSLAAPKIERSTAIDPATGQPMIIQNRTSHGTYFQPKETDFIARLDLRIAALMNWPLENGEGIQILRYGIGGEYRPHFDYFPPHLPGSEKPLTEGGQRVATLIMYLNDVEEGGATIFPEIGLSVQPRKGQALYFSYFNSLGQVDPLTLHGGAPVSRGEKWIATKWMRQWRRT